MDKMSIWSILFVSFPEELLIVVITLALAGYRDVLNFKDKKNIFKLLVASVLMVLMSAILRGIVSSITLISIIQLFIFYFIIIAVYRYKILTCILSFLLSIIILILSESIFSSLILKILNLSLDQVYTSDLIRFLQCVPARIIQVLVALITCKIRNINLRMVKLSINEWINILLFGLMIIASMISIESGLRNINNDFSTILNLIVNILIAVVFSSWMILNIFKLRKKMFVKENMHDVELHHVKNLLEEGQTSYAIELIDQTLYARGYYKK